MSDADGWVDWRSAALLTDLYELTMLRAYVEERLFDRAVFSLFVRRLPKGRNYLLACGLDDVLAYLERLRFDEAALEYLGTLGKFPPDFLEWLAGFRFSGDVFAVPEGTPVFAGEPILEIAAPLPQAQLVETFVLNQIHVQTLLASKASRVVQAARGRAIVDFGLRRTHGADAGLKSARAFYVAGVAATSNVLASFRYGIPVAGTMAHSYVQAHEREADAFEAFARVFPDTVLLVDTYDVEAAMRHVVALSRKLGERFLVTGVRIDSGDLDALARLVRRRLDEAGLQRVKIIASGGLDEEQVDALTASGAPIDAFGVGTAMSVSDDAPKLDVAYKLVEYAGKGRIKLSEGKELLPGQKQVFRREQGGEAWGDVLGRWGEALAGRPLLVQVMRGGRRIEGVDFGLKTARARAVDELARLPERVRALAPADPPYPVEVSAALAAEMERLRRVVG